MQTFERQAPVSARQERANLASADFELLIRAYERGTEEEQVKARQARFIQPAVDAYFDGRAKDGATPSRVYRRYVVPVVMKLVEEVQDEVDAITANDIAALCEQVIATGEGYWDDAQTDAPRNRHSAQ